MCLLIGLMVCSSGRGSHDDQDLAPGLPLTADAAEGKHGVEPGVKEHPEARGDGLQVVFVLLFQGADQHQETDGQLEGQDARQ